MVGVGALYLGVVLEVSSLSLVSTTLLRLCPRVTFLSLALVAFATACEAHDRVLPYLGVHDSGRQADSGKGPRPSDADVSFDSDASLEPDMGDESSDDPDNAEVDPTSEEAGGPGGPLPGLDDGGTPVARDDASASSDAAVPPATPVASDPECDMSGLWMVKQLTRSEALGLGQFANYYYFFELAQDGEDVTVVSQMDCDIRVEGSVSVTINEATRRSLMAHNSQRGRRATMRRQDDTHCALAFERFWSVRGADEARFAPMPRSSKETVAEVRTRLPLPTAQARSGAEDWEEDGQLGIAWQINGIASGTRNTVQRDYTEWFTDETHTVKPARDFKVPLVLRSAFDNDENVINATSGLVGSLAVADQRAEHRVAWSFLGRSASDARARAVLDDDPLVTCNHIVDALPHENGL